jgi:TRAP-type transport system periplasmic protein
MQAGADGNKRDQDRVRATGRGRATGARRARTRTAVAVVILLGAAGFLAAVGWPVATARAAGQPQKVIKIATIAPEGTTWMKLMHELDERVRTETGNRVGFRFYPGGSQGGDLDVLRKIRTGQIQGAGLTGVGLGEIEPSLRIMELPFMFRTVEDLERGHAALDPIFEQRLSERGFTLLGWAEVGFVYLFSQEPVRSVADLKSMKMWLWEGDPLAEALLRTFGVSPVPLNVTDVLTSLQTGIINTIYSTPYGCLSLQWFTRLKCMTDVPITHSMGAVVVTRSAFDELAPDDQATVHRIAAEIFARLQAATRSENDESITVIVERNIARVPVTPEAAQAFEATGRRVWEDLVGKMYDRALLDQLLAALARTGS